MTISSAGTARIRHRETGTVYEISSAELDWNTEEVSERGMGTVFGHVAQIDHPELGILSWELIEYPLGAKNHQSVNLRGHNLLENFSISFSGDDGRDQFENSAPNLVEWFRERYEDPANDTPFNGREGGYLYVWGGPYDARTELEAKFGASVPEVVIQAAIKELESDGIFNWAPGPRHPSRQHSDDEFSYNPHPELEDLMDLAKAGRNQTFGQPEELKARAVFVTRLCELDSELENLLAGIGHNGPPAPVGGSGQLERIGIQSLKDTVVTMRKGLEEAQPDAVTIGIHALNLKQNWLSQKIDKMADGFFEEFGKEFGKRMAQLVTSGLALVLTYTIQSIVDAALHWLAVVLTVTL